MSPIRRCVAGVITPMLLIGMIACESGPKDLLTGRNPGGDATRGLAYLSKGVYGEKAMPARLSGDCFVCHAAGVHGEFQPGLGNAFMDWSELRADSSESLPLSDSLKFLKTILRQALAEHAGPNPAFRIEEAVATHRNIDWTFTDKSTYTIADSLPVPVCDVPPLWNVKKKKRLYYDGQGIGDLRKLMMHTGLVGLRDTVQAREFWIQLADVAAWIASLESPKYPGPIDEELAATGRDLFERECRKCHGSYGFGGSYPNKIIGLERIETDPYYATYRKSVSRFPAWFNSGWFGQSDPPAELEPQTGYVAPPLDGIWASAPYFHNGSVPTLAGVLNSRTRPTLWDRSLDHPEYDSVHLGWKFERVDTSRGASTYDTRKRGYSNQGHTFGDDLTEEDRSAIIEYLKTL